VSELRRSVALQRTLDLVPWWRIEGDDPDARVTSLETDPAKVTAGALFFAVPSTFRVRAASEAVARGAVAVVTDRMLDIDTTQVLVRSVARSIGRVAASFYGSPQAEMTMVGVTGTNGKTTTMHLVRSIFERAGVRVAMLGSGLPGDDGTVGATELTTPQAIDLYRMLSELAASDVDVVGMEVSSHALAQYRVEGIRFDCSIFTNLSMAHVGYHGSLEEYRRAKARLFAPAATTARVVNIDDDFGRVLCDDQVETVTYGSAADATFRIEDVEERGSLTTFRLNGLGFSTRLPGRFNVSNCAAAIAAAMHLGLPTEVVAEAVAAFEGVRARMQFATGLAGVALIDDSFNANPASMAAGLSLARATSSGTVVAVLGEMAELGTRAQAEHRRVGRLAATLGVDRVVAVGAHAGSVCRGTLDVDANARVAAYPSAVLALADLRETLRPGDTVYLKGSRTAALDLIAAALRSPHHVVPGR
jgi:UDP-N-acetylmuramoyl-L-alanyl-D-glutamate--2,6-diaminopimelate ligase